MQQWVARHANMAPAGQAIWQQAERAGVTRHTWQSMLNRWKRYLSAPARQGPGVWLHAAGADVAAPSHDLRSGTEASGAGCPAGGGPLAQHESQHDLGRMAQPVGLPRPQHPPPGAVGQGPDGDDVEDLDSSLELVGPPPESWLQDVQRPVERPGARKRRLPEALDQERRRRRRAPLAAAVPPRPVPATLDGDLAFDLAGKPSPTRRCKAEGRSPMPCGLDELPPAQRPQQRPCQGRVPLAPSPRLSPPPARAPPLPSGAAALQALREAPRWVQAVQSLADCERLAQRALHDVS